MFIKLVYLYLFTLLLSCNNSNEVKVPEYRLSPSNEDSVYPDTLVPNIKNPRTDTTLLDSYIEVTKKSKIEIISMNKNMDTTSKYFKTDSSNCKQWSLSSDDLKKILIGSQSIDGHEFHYYYDIFPCSYSGEIRIDGKIASYKVNAGSFTILSFKDSSTYLGYKKDDYKKYFLLNPGID